MPDPQKTGQPLTLALFALLRDRPEADRRLVYRALVAHDSFSAGDDRVALAAHCLETCADEIARTPSRRAYDEWRSAKDRPREWASSTQIRNAFGSWPKALDALGFEPEPDVLSRRLLRLQDGFTADECLLAIRDCVADLTSEGGSLRRLTFDKYKAWARVRVRGSNAVRDESGGEGDDGGGGRGPGGTGWGVDESEGGGADGREVDDGSGIPPTQRRPRVPVNVKSFHKHFQTWANALAEAGYAELAMPTGGVRHPGPGGPHNAYTKDEILKALRVANEELGGELLRMNAYRDWRQRKLEEAKADGEILHLPGLRVVSTFFGSWSEALAKAGLITDEQHAFWRKQPLREFTAKEMEHALAQAIESRGRKDSRAELIKLADETVAGGEHPGVPNPVISRHAYKSWRKQQLLDEPERRIPSDAVIHDRLEGWDRAVVRALSVRGRPGGSESASEGSGRG